MDDTASQVWFSDLWNYSIVPYLLEAVREGIQVVLLKRNTIFLSRVFDHEHFYLIGDLIVAFST